MKYKGKISRSRALEEFNYWFKTDLLKKIKNKLKKQKKVRILEIGFGEGRVLLQISKKFGSKVELYGINNVPRAPILKRSDLRKAALHFKVIKKNEKIVLPKIYFYDAVNLKFKKNYFDFVISQTTIQYISRKDKTIEETWRVLKKGGEAFLQLDTFSKDFPDFMKKHLSRFTIYKGKREISAESFFKKHRFKVVKNKGTTPFDKGKIKTSIVFQKTSNKQLNLKLKYDENSSFNLRLSEKNVKKGWIGWRSVYKI